MKKIAILLLLTLAGVTTALAKSSKSSRGYWDRENRHSLSLSIGVTPLVLGYTTQIDFTPASDPYYGDDGWLSPSFNLAYSYRINKTFEVEAIVSYITYVTKYFDSTSDEHAFTARDNVFLLTPMLRVNWLNYTHLSLYSSAGVGVGSSKSSNAYGTPGDTRVNPCGISIQATPIGCSYTAKRIFGFCEVGIGSVGFVRAGVGYKL